MAYWLAVVIVVMAVQVLIWLDEIIHLDSYDRVRRTVAAGRWAFWAGIVAYAALIDLYHYPVDPPAMGLVIAGSIGGSMLAALVRR